MPPTIHPRPRRAALAVSLAIVDEGLRLGPPDVARIARTILEGVWTVTSTHRSPIAASRYLKARGFDVVESEVDTLFASHPRLPAMQVVFDGQGRIATVQIEGTRFEPYGASLGIQRVATAQPSAAAVLRLLLDNVPGLASGVLEVVTLCRDSGRCTLVAVASTDAAVNAGDALNDLDAASRGHRAKALRLAPRTTSAAAELGDPPRDDPSVSAARFGRERSRDRALARAFS